MNFKQLVTHYLWSRSFTEKELSRLLGVKEKRIFEWKKGILPTPSEVLGFQESTAYPLEKIWMVYFNSISLKLGEDLPVETSSYQDQLNYLKASQTHRRFTNGNSIPSDEVFHSSFISLREDFALNPQDLPTVLQVQMRHKNNGDAHDKDLKKLAAHYEIDVKELSKLISDTHFPSLEEVENLLNHSSPGYEKRRILLGYYSTIIKFFNLPLYLSEPFSASDLSQLTELSNVSFNKKTRAKKKKS